MNLIDKLVATYDPISAVRRAQAREALAYYEAARPSRHRKLARDKSSGDMLAWKSAPILRDQARALERNYDLARGAINVMVNKVIGPQGITIEPLPRDKNGDIHEDYAQLLLSLWKNWRKIPEVTRTMDYAMAEQMTARTWFRDGECFAQVLEGSVQKLDHGTIVPLSLELLEPDYCPFEYYDPAQNIWQGVQRNAWGQPTNFFVYRNYPGDKFFYPSLDQVKAIPATRMLHVATRDRLSQLRGVSVFASVISRLDDIKDYEESERIAAKIAASMAAYIKKGDPGTYQPTTAVDPVTGEAIPGSRRHLRMQPGMIFDDLAPGEEIGTVDTKRPNVNLETFRSGQLRAVATGIGAGYGSISKSYDGSYSASRQEIVDQFDTYQTLTGHFVARMSRPTWERFVNLAAALGIAPMPADLDRATIADAFFQGPAMPWIDPLKEAEAQRLLVRCGFKSSTQVIRERNSNIHDVYGSLARERKLAQVDKLLLESDPASAKGTPANESALSDQATPTVYPSDPKPGEENVSTIQ